MAGNHGGSRNLMLPLSRRRLLDEGTERVHADRLHVGVRWWTNAAPPAIGDDEDSIGGGTGIALSVHWCDYFYPFAIVFTIAWLEVCFGLEWVWDDEHTDEMAREWMRAENSGGAHQNPLDWTQ